MDLSKKKILRRPHLTKESPVQKNSEQTQYFFSGSGAEVWHMEIPSRSRKSQERNFSKIPLP